MRTTCEYAKQRGRKEQTSFTSLSNFPREREKTIFLPLKSLQKKNPSHFGEKIFPCLFGNQVIFPPCAGRKSASREWKKSLRRRRKKNPFPFGNSSHASSSFLAPGGGGETILKAQGPCSQERGGGRNAFLRSLSPCL